MPTRALWFVPLLLVCGAAVIGLGPYARLAKQMHPVGTFDEAPAKSTRDVVQRLEAIGEAGAGLYRQHFWTDIAFIAFNFAAFWIAFAVILPRADLPAAFMLLPIVAATADLIENIAVRAFLGANPSEAMITLARYATYTKLVSFAAMVVIVAVGVVMWFLKTRGRVAVSP